MSVLSFSFAIAIISVATRGHCMEINVTSRTATQKGSDYWLNESGTSTVTAAESSFSSGSLAGQTDMKISDTNKTQTQR